MIIFQGCIYCAAFFLRGVFMVEFFDALWTIVIIPLKSLSQLDNCLVYPAFMVLIGWVFYLLRRLLTDLRGRREA